MMILLTVPITISINMPEYLLTSDEPLDFEYIKIAGRSFERSDNSSTSSKIISSNLQDMSPSRLLCSTAGPRLFRRGQKGKIR
jgi:hypothetical protein